MGYGKVGGKAARICVTGTKHRDDARKSPATGACRHGTLRNGRNFACLADGGLDRERTRAPRGGSRRNSRGGGRGGDSRRLVLPICARLQAVPALPRAALSL